MITFDPQELKEIIQAVSSANNTDAMPAHSWARAAKVLLAEVERLREELLGERGRREAAEESLDEVVKLRLEITRLRRTLNDIARRALEGKEG